MKITKKQVSNIVFIIIIGLLLYPPTKEFFIKLVSFSPTTVKVEERQQLESYNWQLKGLNTENIDFNKTKGKVVFVNFWATWCSPCRAEMPSIQKLYDAYKDKIEFVFISNEKWNTISDFYIKNGYDLPTYNILSATPNQLKSKTIPATFIIDKKGNIVIEKRGAANWNSDKTRLLLDELLQ